MDVSINKAVNSGSSIAELGAMLLEARNNAHIFHLKTKSYAQHMALGSFYDEILELFDRLIESYQGKYGIVSGYPKSIRLDENGNPIKYLEMFLSELESYRKEFKDGWLQQLIDDMVELTTSTLYKLKNLA